MSNAMLRVLVAMQCAMWDFTDGLKSVARDEAGIEFTEMAIAVGIALIVAAVFFALYLAISGRFQQAADFLDNLAV